MRTSAHIKMVFVLCAFWSTISLQAQQQAGSFYNRALSELEQKNAAKAEQLLRKSTAVDTTYADAPYNLGTHLYQENHIEEAFGHLKEAAQRTQQPDLIHKTHHNIGNIYMQKNEFENAVEAYKQALRNNPEDDQTRYNLALAKQKQQEQQEQQEQNKDQQDDQQKDQEKEQQENEDQQNESDKEKENENEGDSGDPKEKEKENPKENGEGSEKEDQKKGQGDQKQEQGRKPQQDQSKGAPKPQELSKEQIETLLQALQNEENKVQEKMNAKKVQGRKLKVEKDW